MKFLQAYDKNKNISAFIVYRNEKQWFVKIAIKKTMLITYEEPLLCFFKDSAQFSR